MKIALFGAGGPFSIRALERLSATGTVAAMVVPAADRPLRKLTSRLRTRELERTARACGIPLIAHQGGERRFPAVLRALEADLICVASYPYRLGAEVRAAVRLGAINAHPSLLPLHRGPDPLFWTYLAGDRETGVTIHWIDDGLDSGDIILQDRISIPRNTPGVELYHRLADLASDLLVKAIHALDEGSAHRAPQPAANWEPSPARRTWKIDYEEMTTERMAHFLHGISHRRRIEIPDGNRVWHAAGPLRVAAVGLQTEAPGTVVRSRSSITIHLGDGIVELERPPLFDEIRRRLHV